ncbi:hypothetical protein M0811_12648 [Anaeramoeba ignava]|uniref:BTB domain-containing protein n=1 Tax=Anaeramoeba ignava TaxID=1746090 RepID=A0A9Q0L820_ANAIG|nr:hypothetical protein M0811_12648 [Anaeramoeba ignava]
MNPNTIQNNEEDLEHIFLQTTKQRNIYPFQKKSLKKSEIENIQKITVGVFSVLILTSEGNVFAKGKDINSKNPNEFINISSLIEDTNDRIIQDIVSGFHSGYFLTSNQNAYGIGSNKYGQLGFGSESLLKTEKPILMMKNVSKIFSGNSSNSVFLLNSNQELFVCGYNYFKQLGLGKKTREQEIIKLTKIQNIPKGKIIDIQTGEAHSIILIEFKAKRKLYSCGHSQFNGLNKNTREFTQIKSSLFENDDILDFSVGEYHTLILTTKGKLIGFGDNSYGQLGTGNTENQLIPIQIKLPELTFKENIFQLSYFLLKDYENQIEKLQEIISNKSIKESNQIFEMIYSNYHLDSFEEIQKIIQNEKIEETMKRIYLNENEKDFIIERKEKQYKFPKLILIMRSELYRGMFLSVTDDKSNKVTDYSELSNKSFEIFEYWIYSNQIKNEIEITKEMINEIQIGIDYFQLNQTNPNLFDLLINKFNNQN